MPSGVGSCRSEQACRLMAGRGGARQAMHWWASGSMSSVSVSRREGGRAAHLTGQSLVKIIDKSSALGDSDAAYDAVGAGGHNGSVCLVVQVETQAAAAIHHGDVHACPSGGVCHGQAHAAGQR